jgi:Zn-dependent protease/CBS domain-containing protein
MRGSFRVARIGGIDIGVNYSLILGLAFFAWTLAVAYFPQTYPGWSSGTYWAIGILGGILIFASVLLHELAHSFVAKARGLPVKSIVLFIFGGVSNIEKEPERPGVEFTMAFVGPLTSLILGGIFLGLSLLPSGQTDPVAGLLNYLGQVNLVLGVFNLLPGFPMDGGRVLRSIIWGVSGNFNRATNIATITGRVIGWAMILYGVFLVLNNNLLGGLWIAFIGWFLSSAAESSRQQATIQEHLKGAHVRDVMDVSTMHMVSPQTSVEDMVRNVFVQGQCRAAAVSDEGKPVGIVTVADIRKLPREQWSATPVSQVMTREPLYSVKPDDDLGAAVQVIASHDLNQVLVVQDDRLAGMLCRADIIRYVNLSQESNIKPRQV